MDQPARGPTSTVLFLAAGLVGAVTAIAVLTMPASPPPAEQYGPFGDVHALFGVGLLVAILVAVGWWAARGLTPRSLRWGLLLLLVAGPLGWGLGLIDSLGPDLINSTGSAAPFAAMALLVVAPLMTVAGMLAALAEVVRTGVSARPATIRYSASGSATPIGVADAD